MKNTFLLICLCLFLISCEQNKGTINRIPEIIQNCETFEDYTVQVKEGYATRVIYGDDTLAVTTRPMTIKIPKRSNIFTKNNADSPIELKVEFIESNYVSYSNYWQAVMFEDSRFGDYDYNDLIIHVKNYTHLPWQKDYAEQTIEIQPIALGSQKSIKLGCVLSDNSVHIISENVREDLFQGELGFVNTENEKTPIRYKLSPTEINAYQAPIPSSNKSLTVLWFIEVDGKRFFAICGDQEYADYDMVNTEGMPYGLVIPSTFSYPKEKTSMFEAYPQFRGWINGTETTIGSNEESALIYKYSSGGILGEDGKYYKIWDYLDLQ